MVLCQTSVVHLSPASLAPACAGVPPAVYAPSLQSPSSTSAPTPAGYVPLSQVDSQPIQPTSTNIMYDMNTCIQLSVSIQYVRTPKALQKSTHMNTSICGLLMVERDGSAEK